MRDVLQQVQMGMTPEWLSSYVQQKYTPEQIAEETNYMSDDFNSAVTNLQREFADSQKSGGKQDFFSERGLRRPSDAYTLEDVPIPDALVPAMTEVAKRGAGEAQKSDIADRDVRMALDNLSRMEERKNIPQKEMVDYLRRSGEKINKRAVDGEGEIYDWKLSRGSSRPWWDPLRLPDELIVQGSRVAEKIIDQNFGDDNRDVGQLYAKKLREELGPAIQKQMSVAAEGSKSRSRAENSKKTEDFKMQLMRQAALNVANRQGRTPLKDQLNVAMSFLAGM
jgi:hypothetical protein